MAIEDRDVAHIAKLARLRLSSEESALYRGQLGKILESMAELSTLDTKAVAPTSSVLGVKDVLRDDEARAFPGREALLDLAPRREGPYFKVKKVIE